MISTKDCKEFLGSTTHAVGRCWKRVSKHKNGDEIVREFEYSALSWKVEITENKDGQLRISNVNNQKILLPKICGFVITKV